MKSRKIKVGDWVIPRQFHRTTNNPTPIKIIRPYRVREIVEHSSNRNNYVVRVHGLGLTYCPDWFDLSKEHNVRELLSKLEGHEI